MAERIGYSPGQQTVDFSSLVKKAAEESYLNLKELSAIAPEQLDSERKLGLLKYIVKTRQRLLRLLVLSKWCCQMPLVERCQQLEGTLSNHDTSFTQAADFLFYLHDNLQQAKAPIYDIPSAAEVLLTGRYRKLPKCIEDLGMQAMLTGEEREDTLQKLDTMLRSRLLDITLPEELSDITIQDGRIIFRVDGEFEVHLTLGYRRNMALWRVLHLNLLVGESSGPTALTDHQRLALGDDLERRMAASEDPFQLLYSILHEFCTALVMDTLFRQIRMLGRGRWKDAVKFEVISDTTNSGQGVSIGQGTGQGPGPPPDGDLDISGSGPRSRSSPGLKILYWLDLPKGEAGGDPYLRIEPGIEQHIICSHHPSVVDPATESEAEFNLDQSCIDIEKLLLRAIACNIHSRLLEIQRCLKSNSQLCRVDSDIVLRSSFPGDGEDVGSLTADEEQVSGKSGDAGEEVLCVRAYATSFVALGISIRNGHFLLRSFSTLLSNSVLADMEDSLNMGTKMPVDVFVNLRSRSLLHLFASIGASFNLTLYERGAHAIKFPAEGPKLGDNVLVMGFPNCGELYFLSLQLDNNFMPSLMLLEAKPRSHSGRSTLLSGPINVVRWLKFNIDTMLISEDDPSFSLMLLDEGRLAMEMQSSGRLAVSKRHFSNKDLPDLTNAKAEVDIRTKAIGSIGGRDGVPEFGAMVDKFFRVSSGRPSNTLSPGMSPLPSPSSMQGAIPGTQQYGSGLLNQALNCGISSPTGNASLLQSNHRVCRMTLVNGVLASPSRSPLHRGFTTLKSSYGDQEVLQSKSPLNLGDSAASPIDLDDDLSKLIDSISKTSGLPSGQSNPSVTGDLGSSYNALIPRQRAMSRTASLPKSPVNARSSQVKSSLILQGLNPSRTPGQTANSLARLGSPARKPLVSLGSDMSTEWMDLDQHALSVHSPALLSSSPSTRPSTTGMQVQTITPRSVNSTEKAESLKRKRTGAELILSLPSIQGAAVSAERVKKQKMEVENSQSLVGQSAADMMTPFKTSPMLDSFVSQPYSTIVAAANQGKAPSGAYTAVLLQIVRRCGLCIKTARLTRQMDSLGVPYVEEVGLRKPSSNVRFRVPSLKAGKKSKKDDTGGWLQICLCLGKPGDDWEVEVQDTHFRGLWDLQRHRNQSSWGAGVQFAPSPEEDAHIHCTQKGLVLSFCSVEDDSIQKMLADLERLWRARMFALGIRKLLEDKVDERAEVDQDMGFKSQGRGRFATGERHEGGEKKWEVMRRAFRVEAIGLTSTWFTYMASVPGVMARFVVDWEVGHKGCTVHVSPEQLWPHTKYLEDYINGGEVELLLDAIRVTVGPLQSLAAAIRPARTMGPPPNSASGAAVSGGMNPMTPKPAGVSLLLNQVPSPSTGSSATSATMQSRLPNGSTSSIGIAGAAVQSTQAGTIASGPGRPLPGLVPSSLLPTDVSVLLRSPYWIRIIYRKQFAMDMRCHAGDQVWLQPAPPARSVVPGTGGSLPCPQFRPFVMEHVAISLSSNEYATTPGNQSGNGGMQPSFGASMTGWGPGAASASGSLNRSGSVGVGAARPANHSMGVPSRVTGVLGSSQSLTATPATSLLPGRSLVGAPNSGLRGEYTALFGLGDDGGYGGAWVPLAALKKVLRSTLRYLGVLWLFAQFPSILKEVLGSILRENEGALLNHDPEQPALRFFIGSCVFAVSMHRQQLYLQALNVKKFQMHQQHSQQQIQASGPDMELSAAEMSEIGDFFARRVASEPYDASRLASFVTMLTLPVPVIREFLKLIAWKKDLQKLGTQNLGGDGPRPKLELCLENRIGSGLWSGGFEEVSGQRLGTAKSSIRHNRAQSSVDFTLTLSLDAAHLPPINVAGGAGWLPQCVAVRLRYQFSELSRVSVINVEGSHGGRACWVRSGDWEHCKERIMRAVELYGAGNGADQGQGRLRAVAEPVQSAVHAAVVQLRRGLTGLNAPSPMASSF